MSFCTYQLAGPVSASEAVKNQLAKAVPGHDGEIPGIYLTSVINQLADDDALFIADDGTPTVWLVCYIDTNGKRRPFASLLHGTDTAIPTRSERARPSTFQPGKPSDKHAYEPQSLGLRGLLVGDMVI